MSEEEPKIIIDSDWKQEAQQEKQKLADEAAGGEEGSREIPEPHFLEIVNMISMQAAISIGGFKTPDGRVIPPDIHAAKHHIDLLEILQKKTENNLDEKEAAIVSATLHELRMLYIQVATGGTADAGGQTGDSPAG